MSKVFVLDTNKQPLDPVHPGRARLLLTQGKAAVFRHYPFTIILSEAVSKPQVHGLRLKIDPGSKTTGLALVNDATGEVVWAAELAHRGEAIKKALDKRQAARRSRRQRKTRYRQPRFSNRRRRECWLPPSLLSRVENVLTWAGRLLHLTPITAVSMELVRFDTQLMQHPETRGMQYQQGELAGYEIRQYLLEKWSRRCAYCDVEGMELQVEHILCRKRGGTNRVSNLTIACGPCNDKKGTQLIQDFLANQPERLTRILSQAKAPLKDAAAVNATRWELYRRLEMLGLPVETGTGGRTKWNRTRRGLPKTHWLDAACVGASTPDTLHIEGVIPLHITAIGRQARQMCLMDKYGFPRTHAKAQRLAYGFQTGDMVRAVVPTGAKKGTYTGKVSIRASGSFTIQGQIQDIHHRFCVIVHRCDGYRYSKGEAAFPPAA
jgi:5-methylcytosine-specific restriction endonuclease McrA